MTAGCTGKVRGGILYLTLDTRGSSVNVFTPAVALELEAALEAGLARGARAVVVQSAKPGSFVNGVGLLLAASSHSQGAAMERARTLQRCYERLAAAPVPTVAAIEGNCYGCGLELALTCDYRIARESYDTHFYMPELRDYAFIPLFGGTQRLPRLLGLKAGMQLLLGERVGARRALRLGLVDLLAPEAGVGKILPLFLAGLRKRGWPKRAPRTPRASTGAPVDIGALPGPERALAREGLRLARLPLGPGYRLEDGLREELAGFWSSLGTRQSERAMSFFFVRQTAKAYAIGSAAYQRPRRLSVRIGEGTPALRRLGRLLRARPLPGVELGRPGSIAEAKKNKKIFFFAQEKVPGALTCALDTLTSGADCAAHLPFPGEPNPLVELVPRDEERPWRRGGALFQFLEQAGLAPVVTRARGRFVSQRLLEAFHQAVAGVPAPAARAALLEFGFRLPSALSRKLGPPRAGPRRVARGLADRVALALARECIRALDEGALPHPSQADLLAHLLLGFPVAHGGLLRWAASSGSAGAARILGRR
jgi:enoyl-CoA hydratase/carnithine racemase